MNSLNFFTLLMNIAFFRFYCCFLKSCEILRETPFLATVSRTKQTRDPNIQRKKLGHGICETGVMYVIKPVILLNYEGLCKSR